MAEAERQRAIVVDARRFADAEIRPRAGETDTTGTFPRELVARMAGQGYLGARLPSRYGGLDLDAPHYGLLLEHVGRACSAAHSLVTVQSSLVGETLLRWGTEEQKNRWLPAICRGDTLGAFALSEPEVGSDAGSVRTSYAPVDGGGYRITGTKTWISFGDIADVFIVVASADDQTSAFIVERGPGVRSRPVPPLMAGRGAHVAEVVFDRVAVPETSLLARAGAGFSLVASTALDAGRYCIAWAGVAIAQEALAAMVAYARNRRQFGRPLRTFQLVQRMVARAVTGVHAARALCMRAGQMRLERSSEAIIETVIAKYHSSKIAVSVTSDAVQVHGAMGLTREYPVERLYREAKVLEIVEGTSEIQEQLIARFGLRLPDRG